VVLPVAVAGPVVPAPAASAGPAASGTAIGTASEQVSTLLARVHAVQRQVAAAERRYNSAFGALANSVSASVTADERSGAVAGAQQAAVDQLDQRVQGLYESGGPLAEYASILVNGDAASFADQTMLATRVVTAQAASVQSATVTADRAATVAADASSREHRSIGTERSVAAAAGRVSSLLAQMRSLLSQANARLAADRMAARDLAEIEAAQQAFGGDTSTFSTITQTSIAGLRVLPPSAEYLALYHGAAKTCPGLSWTVLASIGQVESGHGRNVAVSSAGAQGPMQFEPATFASYAVDGDHDGVASITSPADSIYTAAHYLCADGAGSSPAGLSSALLHYNHAAWYVAMVLKLSGEYAAAQP
jgi:membrane-bound lytic murein transglycosylase B